MLKINQRDSTCHGQKCWSVHSHQCVVRIVSRMYLACHNNVDIDCCCRVPLCYSVSVCMLATGEVTARYTYFWRLVCWIAFVPSLPTLLPHNCTFPLTPHDTPKILQFPIAFALGWELGWWLSVLYLSSCAVICAFLYFCRWWNKASETACKLQTTEGKGSCFHLSGVGAQITPWGWAKESRQVRYF